MIRGTLRAVLFSCLFVVIVGPAARAENSWTANFSEKELKLQNPVDAAWDKWFQSDIGYQRMVERNSPFVELVNDASSTSPITQFHLTIGDSRFNFAPVQGADFVALGRTTPGFSLTSSTANLGDDLIVNIGGGGLQPGKLLRFKIKLGIDASFASTYAASFGSSVPDYRTVLFDMNGVNVYDNNKTEESSDDNAKAFVVFNPGGQSQTAAFPDEDVPVSQFFNNNIRGGCCCTGDPVQIFQLEGSQVPEPGTFALAILGIAGFFLNSRSRRQRLAA